MLNVAKPLQHGAADSHTRSEEPTKKGHLHVTASQCNPVQMASMPPLGQLQSAVSSVIHDILDSDCAAECAASNSLEALKQTLASLSHDTLLEILLSALKTK